MNWTIKNLKNMFDSKETLSFDHPIQRQSSQWNNLQQSLLVHSILANFPVPAIYVQKTENAEMDEKGKPIFRYSVLDGKQRMTTIFSYVNGDYSLNGETPNATIDDEIHELAGKNFEDLEDDVQQELLRFKFLIYAFEEATDDEIEEIFFRLNNSTPLTKPQKSKPLMGVANSRFVDKILNAGFFKEKCNFSKLQLRKSDDMCTLLQSMILLDNRYQDYEYKSISADEVMKYSSLIKNNYSEEQKTKLLSILIYLDKAFDCKEKVLKKINIPIIILMTDTAIDKKIQPDAFHDWLLYFFVSNKEYSQYCSSGSIKKEKVAGRIETMEKHFYKHFKINTTEDLTKKIVSEETAEENPEIIQNDNSPKELLEKGFPEDKLPIDDNTEKEGIF